MHFKSVSSALWTIAVLIQYSYASEHFSESEWRKRLAIPLWETRILNGYRPQGDPWLDPMFRDYVFARTESVRAIGCSYFDRIERPQRRSIQQRTSARRPNNKNIVTRIWCKLKKMLRKNQ